MLTLGVTAHQIGQGTLANDQARIAAAVANPDGWLPDAATLDGLLAEVAERRWCERWGHVLTQLEDLCAHGAMGVLAEAALRSPSTRRLRWMQRLERLRSKVADRLPG